MKPEDLYTKVLVGGPDQCWPWMGHRMRSGYGLYQWYPGGMQAINKSAHRTAWELAFGAIPDGLHVLHKCDNKLCTNPAHLFLGTAKDNAQDYIRKHGNPSGFSGRSHTDATKAMQGSQGTAHPTHKLVDADVLAIRAERGITTARVLAARYGVSISCIKHVLMGRSWRHL